uniref:uncharacterized protein LOC101291924 isoform X1 n=1 Tax=Fragaria vesca subsp. vesca TaxID=101020 RepID=UPI0005C9ED7A|nr:PREDICTED: uncharacterized protein LOC101291924 isoform X1 [Fragaria vesca subsp. vesca]
MNFDFFRNEFGTGESERGKDEGNSCGFREIGNKVGVFVHEKADGVVKCGRSSQDQCLSKISGSSESPSSLSEPTDIKNWFSSYVYESPSLGTTDGFGDSLAKQSKCEKDRFLVENSKRENEEELRNSSVKRSISREVVGEKEQSGGLSNCDSSWRVTKQARQSIPEVLFCASLFLTGSRSFGFLFTLVKFVTTTHAAFLSQIV